MHHLKNIILFMMITMGIFSCQQNRTKDSSTSISTTKQRKTQSQLQLPKDYHQYIHSRYEYPDSINTQIIIQNSFPKGGLQYTDPTGNSFTYAIFWTHITNVDHYPLALNIQFSKDSLKLPSAPEHYFHLLLLTKNQTLETNPMTYFSSSGVDFPFHHDPHHKNYGITNLDSLLDRHLNQASSLQTTIRSNQSVGFFVVTLFNKGLPGPVRSGLSKKRSDLFYRVNDREIPCGQLLLKE